MAPIVEPFQRSNQNLGLLCQHRLNVAQLMDEKKAKLENTWNDQLVLLLHGRQPRTA
jgi:hypothetical protein